MGGVIGGCWGFGVGMWKSEYQYYGDGGCGADGMLVVVVLN